MMRWIMLVLVFMNVVACQKEDVSQQPVPPGDVHPLMSYINLSDTTIVFGKAASYDLDSNGSKDVYFATQLVGDPLRQQDKKQWLAGGSLTTHFPINANESIPVMNAMDEIPVVSFLGYNWYNAPEIRVAQKIISMNMPPYWEGDWKEANHRYIPVQIKTDSALYNGWVEVSFSTDNETMILHKAALSKKANKAIKAGK